MDNQKINTILLIVIIYMLAQKNKCKQLTTEEKLKYAEAVGIRGIRSIDNVIC